MRIKLLAFRAALVAVATAALAMPVPRAEAAAALPANVGVHSHLLWEDYDNAARAAMLDKLAEAKVSWLRLDIGWATLEEAGRGKLGQWYVNRLDWVVAQAQARGIKVLGMIWATPKWANGGKEWNAPPKDVRDYANVARWAAKRYKGRIAAWELWNEASDDYFWDGDVASYVSMVRATYPAIKAADPGATVVVGGTVYNDDKWFSAAYDAGMGGYFDALSTHPYMGPSNAPPEQIDNGRIWRIDHVRAVRQLMVDRGDADKPIWFTEWGWSSHENTAGAEPWNLGVAESVQADFMVRALRQIAREYPYVSHVFWYTDRDTVTGDEQDDNRGLLRHDLSPKPAYETLKALLNPAAVPSTTTSTLVAAGHVEAAPGRSGWTSRWWWLALIVPLITGLALERAGRRWRRSSLD